MSSGASAAFNTQPTIIQSTVAPDASAATVPNPVAPTTQVSSPSPDASAASSAAPASTVSSYVTPTASAAAPASTVSSYVTPTASAAAPAAAASTVSSYVTPTASAAAPAAAASTLSSYVTPTASAASPAAAASTLSSYVTPDASAAAAAAATTLSSYVTPTASAAAAATIVPPYMDTGASAATPTIVPAYIDPFASASAAFAPAYIDPFSSASGAYNMSSQSYLASGPQYNVTSPPYIMSANQSASSPTFLITPSGPSANSVKSEVMSLTDRIKSDIASLNAAQASGAFGTNSVNNIKSSVVRSANRIQGNIRGNNGARTMRQYERKFDEEFSRNPSGSFEITNLTSARGYKQGKRRPIPRPKGKDRGVLLGTYIAGGLDYTNGSLGNRKTWQSQLGVSYTDASNNDTTGIFADINRLAANGATIVLSFMDTDNSTEEFSFECADSCTYDSENKGTTYALFNIGNIVIPPITKRPTIDNTYEIYATVDGKPYRGIKVSRSGTQKKSPKLTGVRPIFYPSPPVRAPTPPVEEETVNNGSEAMNDGSEAMNDGSGTMNDGSGTMNNGSGTMNNGSGTMNNGSNPMNNGTATQFNENEMYPAAEENTFQEGGKQYRARRNGRLTKKKRSQPKKRTTRKSR